MLKANTSDSLSIFLKYLSQHKEVEESLPPLADLSISLGINISRLREQLEVARALGLVDVRPRTGTRRLPYTFTPAVLQSLVYAISMDQTQFNKFADLRKHVESAYWHEAVEKLTEEDKKSLQDLMASAWGKLNGEPVKIPHNEHRQLHLAVFSKLNNPFVTGILEAYWDAYEAVGLNVYTEFKYLKEVWNYHQKMVDAICANKFEEGYQALLDHTDLIYQRPK